MGGAAFSLNDVPINDDNKGKNIPCGRISQLGGVVPPVCQNNTEVDFMGNLGSDPFGLHELIFNMKVNSKKKRKAHVRSSGQKNNKVTDLLSDPRKKIKVKATNLSARADHSQSLYSSSSLRSGEGKHTSTFSGGGAESPIPDEHSTSNQGGENGGEAGLGGSWSPDGKGTQNYASIPVDLNETPMASTSMGREWGLDDSRCSDLEMEVQVTIGIGRCVGIDVSSFKDQIRDLILGEGVKNWFDGFYEHKF
ncbi:hypothetical protein L1987_05500 [Smallanthus sonchifolius]|uniref:Uncharacterized protein n=1 Tax=Smallanthus sonchifolius TaxID=185202 RepID=A0ACB9JVK9_9ASTR|nr:hypothetical protein L1987_05500 [Smallanthus sonchifolius]